MKIDQMIRQLDNTKFQESEESANSNPWLKQSPEDAKKMIDVLKEIPIRERV